MKGFLAAVQEPLSENRAAIIRDYGLTPVEDAILNMSVIDAIYEKAGMPLRI